MVVRRISSAGAECGGAGGPRLRIGGVTALTVSLERLRGVDTCQAPAFGQLGYEPGRMGGSVGNTGLSDIENGAAGTAVGGVGKVRHPVGAHAPGELQVAGHHLLHQGRRACWAAWYWEALTPRSCAPVVGSCPPLPGSG